MTEQQQLRSTQFIELIEAVYPGKYLTYQLMIFPLLTGVCLVCSSDSRLGYVMMTRHKHETVSHQGWIRGTF